MKPVLPDPWAALRAHTPARIALGRAGGSLPTREVLGFGLAHARARDAVHHALDVEKLLEELKSSGYHAVSVRSAAPDRATYLDAPGPGTQAERDRADGQCGGRRRDRGRPVGGRCADACRSAAERAEEAVGAMAKRAGRRRDAGTRRAGRRDRRADEGEAGGGADRRAARASPRPTASGVYLTYAPRVGRTDAERNCISNVRPQGLGYAEAARRLDWLASAALARGLTGIGLKDESGLLAGRT